ncbi:uncharacterized protein LOC134135718 isoform X1 [Rhea pennata]|uniref:uncharacterized protein LOC134135718 isoform X1 n=1 Tax=Rhea pennata TaxID=8795 RepID=UPI002E257569
MVGLGPSEVPPTAAVRFVGAGAAACFADLVTFPLDTAKVRLQIQGEAKAAGGAAGARYRGVFGTIATMVRTEGARSLYSGLVAGLQRQVSFASVRIGLYDSVKQFYAKAPERAGLGSRLLAGCTTGALAVALAQPTDVVKVRFQARARAEGARRYQGTVDAYRTIAKEEGVRGLWKGTSPNIARNAIVNCAELVTYDVLKDALLESRLMTGESVPPRRSGVNRRGGAARHRNAGVRGPPPAPAPHWPPLGRSPPVPLRRRLRGRLLRHARRLARGRGEDALHELRARAVRQRRALRPRHARRGGPAGFLQGVHARLPAPGLLERGDVRDLRAAETGPHGRPRLAGSPLLSPPRSSCRAAAAPPCSPAPEGVSPRGGGDGRPRHEDAESLRPCRGRSEALSKLRAFRFLFSNASGLSQTLLVRWVHVGPGGLPAPSQVLSWQPAPGDVVPDQEARAGPGATCT